MPMVKAIIFDCFGVLATDIWLAFCDSLPQGVNIEEVRALNKAFDRGIISEAEFTKSIQDLTGKKPPLLTHLESGQMAKNDALIDLIRSLKPDFKTAILSNISSDWITREFLTAEERSLFDTFVLSYEVGMIKPEPRMYALACERLQVAPHEALMVDDRLMFVDGAREAGLSGIVYEDLHSFKKELNDLLNSDY